MIKLTAGQE